MDDFHHHLTLQTFYAVRALEETGVVFSRPDQPERGWGVPDCDHRAGTCRFRGAPNPARRSRFNDTTYSLLFPRYLLETAASLHCAPGMRTGYFFRGTTVGSTWRWALLGQFRGRNDSTIETSYRGRDPARKYTLDLQYLRSLCCAKFALTPSNDCPWSYRFFEAIMCLAIPVLHDGDDDKFARHFHHLRSSTLRNHTYDVSLARANLRTLKRWHTLPDATERFLGRPDRARQGW